MGTIRTPQLRTVLVGLCILVLTACEFSSPAPRKPQERIVFQFDERSWVVGYRAPFQGGRITEYVLEGEDVDDWSELVTILGPAKATPRDMYEFVAGGSEIVKAPIIHETKKDICFECYSTARLHFKAESSIFHYMAGRDGLYSISYAVKTPRLDRRRFIEWRERIRNTNLVPNNRTESK